jgi:hypothetical protein
VIEAKAFTDSSQRILDFAVDPIRRQINETRREIREKRFQT